VTSRRQSEIESAGVIGTDEPRPAAAGFSEFELPAVFELLSRVARAVVATIGTDAEVVVHDLRTPERSVVAISGSLTGRSVGAPIPDPELLPGVVDRYTEDDLRRRARTSSGRELVASTTWIRDTAGHIVGAMCVNVDHSALRQARDLIDRHLAVEDGSVPALPTFAASVTDFTRLAIASVLGPVRRRRLRSAERLELIRKLDADGIFAVRHAADAVAAELSVSRSSVYSDLRQVRAPVVTAMSPGAARPSRVHGRPPDRRSSLEPAP